MVPSGPGVTCTARSLLFLAVAAATWSAAMRVATLRATVVIRAGSIPTTRSTRTSSTAAHACVVEAVAGGDHLAGVDGGQLAGEDFAQQFGEPPGQGFGQADLAPGGPLAEPGGQGDLAGGHRVDEPDLVVDLDRARSVSRSSWDRRARSRPAARPRPRWPPPCSSPVTSNSSSWRIPAPCAASRCPTAAASARNAAIRSRS